MVKENEVLNKMKARLEKLVNQFDEQIAVGNEKGADLIEKKINQLEDDIATEEIAEAQTNRKKPAKEAEPEDEDDDVCLECGRDLIDVGNGLLECEECGMLFEKE